MQSPCYSFNIALTGGEGDLRGGGVGVGAQVLVLTGGCCRGNNSISDGPTAAYTYPAVQGGEVSPESGVIADARPGGKFHVPHTGVPPIFVG